VSTLEKAVLEELDKSGKVTETIPVQFNPASLKLQMTNSTDGAESRGRQVQQYNGSASTSLSVELEFDTADEGTTGQPLDVRTRTAGVARFVLPGGEGSKQAPPRVQFRWGTLIVAGVMTSLSEELDLFSAEGVPLRAKVGVEIKEQDPKFEALERGPGANGDTGRDSRTAEALDGESAADFLARNGLNPAVWRAIAGALDNPLSLSAGLAVDFSASLSLEAGIGVSVGFGAALDVSLGLEASVGIGADADLSAGFALAEAGGITAASQAVAATAAASEADRAKAAFGVALAPQVNTTADAARAPLASVPSARTLGPAPAPPRPLPPRADPRAVTFGRGVPLRERVTPPDAAAGTGGYVVVALRPPSGVGPQRAPGSGTAPWEQLPSTPGAATADVEQQRRAPTCGCHRCDPVSQRRYGR